MIIGIDGNEANIKDRVGVNMYAFELLCSISKLQKEWDKKYKLIVYLKNPPLPDMPEQNSNFKYRILPGGGFWIITKLMPDLFLGKARPDIFFSPSHYIPPFAPMPRVCSIMDLGYLKFSGQFRKKDFWQLKLWTAMSIFSSKAVIAISESTRDDIVRHYPFAVRKTHITSLGYDQSKFGKSVSQKEIQKVKKRYSIAYDYILYLGTLKPSKNVEGLIEAYKTLITSHPEILLVIAGKKGWLYDTIFKKVKKLGLEGKVIFTGFVSEKDKPAIIKGAKVFVLPSFWEGFGLDVLSAMACGVPVIVSNVGSLPEVVGNAGYFIDPKSSDDIADKLKKVLTLDKFEYNKVVEKGVSKAQKFSWEETARKTIAIIENVCR
ncbi:glycosyltransferase family 4 protein [Patescibacteria group bacterium]